MYARPLASKMGKLVFFCKVKALAQMDAKSHGTWGDACAYQNGQTFSYGKNIDTQIGSQNGQICENPNSKTSNLEKYPTSCPAMTLLVLPWTGEGD